MKRELLVAVPVIFVACVGIAAINAKRICPIGIVGEQARALKVIHARRIGASAAEVATAILVRGGVGIGAEVVIEGDIFLEDHDDMLDRSARGRFISFL